MWPLTLDANIWIWDVGHKYSNNRRFLSSLWSGWLCWQMLAGDRHRANFSIWSKDAGPSLTPASGNSCPFRGCSGSNSCWQFHLHCFFPMVWLQTLPMRLLIQPWTCHGFMTVASTATVTQSQTHHAYRHQNTSPLYFWEECSVFWWFYSYHKHSHSLCQHFSNCAALKWYLIHASESKGLDYLKQTNKWEVGDQLVECLPRKHKAPSVYKNQVWWYVCIIPALYQLGWREENQKFSCLLHNEFEANLGYMIPISKK